MKKVIGVFIAFCASALLGIAAIVIGACGENGAFGGYMKLSDLTKDNIKEGLIVEGDIYDVWDNFAVHEKDENGEKITLASYFTLVMPHSYSEEAPVFIGISSSESDEIAGLEQMTSEAQDMILNEGASENTTIMHFRGRIKKPDENILALFKVSVNSLIGIEGQSSDDYIAPYVIESYNGSDFMLLLIVGIALTITGVVGVLILILKDFGEDR